MLLSNEPPDYALYRVLNVAQVLPGDKKLGVQSLAAGESWIRLTLACNVAQTGNQATTTCGNTQLCAGTRAGIEGKIHIVHAIWPQLSDWNIGSKGALIK